MAGNRTITSPTDTPEQIATALASTFTKETPAEPVKAAEAEVPAKVEDPPVVDEKPALEAKPEAEDDGEDDETEIDAKADTTPAKRSRGDLKARISELTRQRHDSVRERDAAIAEKAALQSQLNALMAKEPKVEAKVSADEPEPKPVSADFGTYDEFTEAMGTWATKEAARAARVEIAKSRKEDADQAAAAVAKRDFDETIAKYNARVQATREANPDFDEITANPDLQFTPPMRDAILNSEFAGEILLHLARHPDECVKLTKLAPGPALVAMGRIEAKVESTRTTTTSEPAKKTVTTSTARSVARVPIAPVGGTAVTSTKSINEMTFQEHRAARRAGTLR